VQENPSETVEKEYLLHLLRLENNREGGGAFRSYAKESGGSLEPGSLLNLLRQHGLAPYGYLLLRRHELLDLFPRSFVEGLRGISRASTTESFALLTELRRLASLFRRERIKAVPVKGAALFTTLYGQPGLRPMRDIDLLIRRGDLERAERLLLGSGYTLSPLHHSEEVRRFHFHLPFAHQAKGIRVEIHWRLADEETLPPEVLEGIWQRIIPGDELGPRLDGAAEFLYLALHAAKHGVFNGTLVRREELRPFLLDPLSGNRAIWFLDLRKLMALGEGISLDRLRALAEEWGVSSALYSSVSIVAQLFGPVDGWSWPEGERPEGEGLLKVAVLASLAEGSLRGKKTALGAVRRLQRMDHTLQVRPVRALDLLDLLSPTEEEVRRWSRGLRLVLLPFLFLSRFLAGLGKAALRLYPIARYKLYSRK
jgi:hypothetical protein